MIISTYRFSFSIKKTALRKQSSMRNLEINRLVQFNLVRLVLRVHHSQVQLNLSSCKDLNGFCNQIMRITILSKGKHHLQVSSMSDRALILKVYHKRKSIAMVMFCSRPLPRMAQSPFTATAISVVSRATGYRGEKKLRSKSLH